MLRDARGSRRGRDGLVEGERGVPFYIVALGQGGKFEPVLNVAMPLDRRELIGDGYAWAASSLSRGDFLFGTGADETAALWDRFVEEFGTPERSYVFGASAGGRSALIAAHRYADRFDGVLAICPGAGERPDIRYIGDTLVAALYASDVTQDQFDPSNAPAFVTNSLLPALTNSAIHRRFVDTWIQLTGGPRPFAEEGLRLQENYLLDFGAKLIAYGTVDNTAEIYRASDGSGSLDDLNARAVRISSPHINYAAEVPDNVDGAFIVPVLSLHASGDALDPPSAAAYVRNLVDSAGKHALLFQRSVDSPKHCGFQASDIDRALGDLVAWVEQAMVPTP